MGEAFELEEFTLAIERDRAGRCSVRVSGELDLATAPTFVEEVFALLALPIDTMCLDLGTLSFLDSSGLRALDSLRTRAAEQDVRLLLESVPEQAQQLLELTDMAGLFEYARAGTCTPATSQ
jgi:anti-anti-sigma factor